MIRFLHSADWQLGMTRHFLSEEAEGRFRQDRIDVIERMARVAEERHCEFAVVAGDVFETNQVDRRTTVRTLEALEHFRVPVLLLPGNHDPLDAGSVFRSEVFRSACPDHVHVLDGEQPFTPTGGVEVIGAPWRSKRPLTDLASEAASQQEPDPDVVRILVAHGQIDALIPDTVNPAVIRLASLEEAVAAGKVQYVALGDRHGTRDVGKTGRIWYAGTPEATAYREDDPGNALVVACDRDRIEVERVPVGSWRFVEVDVELDVGDDVRALADRLSALEDKPRTVVKLGLSGTLTLAEREALEQVLSDVEDRVAALERPASRQDLHLRPGDSDFSDLPLRGYAAAARDRLQELVAEAGAQADAAADALGLLLRLSAAGEGER